MIPVPKPPIKFPVSFTTGKTKAMPIYSYVYSNFGMNIYGDKV